MGWESIFSTAETIAQTESFAGLKTIMNNAAALVYYGVNIIIFIYAMYSLAKMASGDKSPETKERFKWAMVAAILMALLPQIYRWVVSLASGGP